MTKMQVDLIDMWGAEYNDFKWILYVKDHFTKYSGLYVLMSKEAVNIAEILKKVSCQFGPSRILQSDNGREFLAKVIVDLAKLWSRLLIVNGRPRHLQS